MVRDRVVSVLAGSESLSPVACEVLELSLERESVQAVENVREYPPLCQLLEHLKKIAEYDEPVLLLGESGVGKEALAQAIYLLDPRRREPFVSVNCPQLTDANVTVSELWPPAGQLHGGGERS